MRKGCGERHAEHAGGPGKCQKCIALPCCACIALWPGHPCCLRRQSAQPCPLHALGSVSFNHLAPDPPPACPARCARCNGDFIPQPLPVEQLPEGHGVPEGIQRTHTEFWVCSRWWVPTEGLGRVVEVVQVLARAPWCCTCVRWRVAAVRCGAVSCCMAGVQHVPRVLLPQARLPVCALPAAPPCTGRATSTTGRCRGSTRCWRP